MRHLSRGTKMSIRLLGLACVNIGVYAVYVRAIERAKYSGVRGKLHEADGSQYDEIVRASYRAYVDSDKGGRDEAPTQQGRSAPG